MSVFSKQAQGLSGKERETLTRGAKTCLDTLAQKEPYD